MLEDLNSDASDWEFDHLAGGHDKVHTLKDLESKIEDLEKERVTYLKSMLWDYANEISSSCVEDDQVCDDASRMNYD